jgi:hypothetical protein
MKKTLYTLIAVVAVALVPTTASAQFNLSRLLGGLSKVANAQTEKEDPYQRLAEAAPSSYTLNGNWTYQSASFSYLGSSPLADIAIAQIDPIITNTLKQLSITPGSVKLRLNGGKGTITQGDHVLEGSYVYTRSKAAIVAETTLDGKTVKASGYVRYESGELTVLLDARELINAMTTIMPELKKDQNILLVETLIKDLKDVYVVGKFTK